MSWLWQGIKKYVLKEEQPFIKITLCGVPLKVLKKSIRLRRDKDDAWWFHLVKHHNILFDIGSNVGYMTLLSLIQNPNRQVVLVDPNPKVLQAASKMFLENHFGFRVNFYSAFVSANCDEEVKFYTIGTGAAGSMYASHAKTASQANSFIQVKTVTLDFLMEFYNILPDLVKIDVEGAEALVLEGAKKLSEISKCSFFVEMHRNEDLTMETNTQRILDWCEVVSYRAWYLKTGSQLTSVEAVKGRGKYHLLLLPKEKPYPNYLTGIAESSPLPNLL
ncbi:FkbM family methyltransferase [Mangrovimonas sp. CR14]|uniref:FkbM family methyltransferase n=1 Tax=Mangrovimonas sp. CR14 TaxID=2706120 RepID=UPI00141E089C|nr:FkbM family methyltransferase [Mangrovimonas sp. CR14]NIK92545.1 FkbM family methyltransferase [Mangrovimonas sp. CR14]